MGEVVGGAGVREEGVGGLGALPVIAVFLWGNFWRRYLGQGEGFGGVALGSPGRPHGMETGMHLGSPALQPDAYCVGGDSVP